jgi:hypothetical protein
MPIEGIELEFEEVPQEQYQHYQDKKYREQP